MQINDSYIESQRPALRQVPDLERALYVLQMWQTREPNANPFRVMKEYMVRNEAVAWVTEHLLTKLPVEIKPEEKTEKRKDKYSKLEKFALDNIYGEFTTQQLVDESGLGAQTITKWAKTTGFFRSIGKGKWEARNPKEDRKYNS